MKKRILITVVSLITFSFVTVRADWPQYLGPGRNGHSPEKALATSWPKKGPKVLWTQPMGKGFAGVAIRDGKVYVLDRVDSQKDVLRCFDLANGNELWTYSNDDPGEFSSTARAPLRQWKMKTFIVSVRWAAFIASVVRVISRFGSGTSKKISTPRNPTGDLPSRR